MQVLLQVIGMKINVQEQIEKYITSQPEHKRSDLHELYRIILLLMPECKLWFLDGKNSENKTVSNPNIGYGFHTIKYADGKTGEILKNKTIAIDSNRISTIYDNKAAGSDSTIVIDGKGKYLIPGLWDMHAHYKWSHVDLDPLLITNGITGVREMWGNMPSFVEIPKRAQQEGLVSPDVYLSGDLIDGNPPSFPAGSLVVTTPDEAVDAVKKQIDQNVDFIKV